MMDYQLTVRAMLDRAVTLFPDKEIVTRRDDGSYHRYTYADAYERICQLAHAVDDLGLESGDRAAVVAVNHYRHYELYFGPAASGRSNHMMNHRLPEEHFVHVLNEAGSKVLFLDPQFLDTVEPLADRLDAVEQFVVLDDAVPETSLEPVVAYEDLLAGQPTTYDWPDLDEDQECAMCYTSGTTGLPKGVQYSHRGIYLHSMMHGHADAFEISENDVILPVVPMFHVNGWGLPYSGTFVGAKLVLPGGHTDVPSVAEMVREEDVTVAAAVPTIWIDMESYLDSTPEADISTLDRILVGGSAPPAALMKRYEEEFGAPIIQGYGMTETAPNIVNFFVTSELAKLPEDEQYRYRRKAGIPAPGAEVRIRDGDGNVVPRDGETKGEVEARGPWVIDSYYQRPDADAESFTEDVPTSGASGGTEGRSSSGRWLKTGDVATQDQYGYIDVVDRKDDIVKSGGEWISSVELENELMAHPAVEEATAVSVPHERWQERPVAYVVTSGEVTEAELREHLLERFPKWWLPDRVVFVDEIPRTTTGKFDKKALREQFVESVGTLSEGE